MIIVVDYGMGNLRSVSKALEHLGGKVKVSSSPHDVEKADKLVLPGVGAFGDAVKELKARKLLDPLRMHLKNQKPFLGICLGLQLLFPTSEENPDAEGLAIYPGKVKLFKSSGIKIPHMGWNQVRLKKSHPLLKSVSDDSFFYFVHSYYAVPTDSKIVAGGCQYGEEDFAAILATDTVFATQFHPEKSQEAGLKILKNFLEW
jgi:glutamine amidotransferase